MGAGYIKIFYFIEVALRVCKIHLTVRIIGDNTFKSTYNIRRGGAGFHFCPFLWNFAPQEAPLSESDFRLCAARDGNIIEYCGFTDCFSKFVLHNSGRGGEGWRMVFKSYTKSDVYNRVSSLNYYGGLARRIRVN